MVVPNGFDEALIPSILARNREWIRRNEERLQQQIKFLEPRVTGGLPERISLRAVGQEWCVTYRHRMGIGVTAVERGGQQLLVHGDIHNDSAVLDALQRWLSRKTREHIVRWLESLARERRYDIGRVEIRSQRTRWASCSAKGTISLNLRLLFLPPDLVRYVLLHELVHTREMNHGRRYWTLLESLEPNYAVLDEELRAGWRLLPDWIRPKR